MGPALLGVLHNARWRSGTAPMVRVATRTVCCPETAICLPRRYGCGYIAPFAIDRSRFLRATTPHEDR